MLTLRPYQVDAHKILLGGLSKSGKGLLVAPTGSGKTLTALQTVVDLCKVKKLKKVVWVAHQKDLVLQSMNAMREHFTVEQVSENSVSLDGVSYFFMPWQALRSKKDLDQYDVLIVDEYHQGSSGIQAEHKSFSSIILKSTIKYQLYVTATPRNLDPKFTKDLFIESKFNPKIVAHITLSEMEKHDAVCNVSMIMVQTADTLILKKWDGQSLLDESGIGETVSGKNEILADAIQEKKVSTKDSKSKNVIRLSIVKTLVTHYFEQEVRGKSVIPPTLMFASVIGEAGNDDDPRSSRNILRHVKKIFAANDFALGPKDVQVDHGGSEKGIQKDFRDGKFPIMIVVRKAREGFDYPALQVAVDFCPSRSKDGETAQVQKLGRVLRKHHSKTEARYYVPDSVNFYIEQQGIRQEFNPEFKNRVFDAAKGLDLDSESAKDAVLRANETVFALRQAELGDDNPIVTLAPTEVLEAEYLDLSDDDVAVDAVRKSRTGTKTTKVIAVKVAYAITEASSSDNKEISSFRLFDGGICERAAGVKDSEGKKKELLKIARKGKPKPTAASSFIGRALHNYLCKSSLCYDPEFKTELEKLRPDWFLDQVQENKEKIIEIAKSCKDKPDKKSYLGRVLVEYIGNNRWSSDLKFKKELKNLRPDWFITQKDRVKLKKEAILKIAKMGSDIPGRKSDLGESLGRYSNEKNKSYDKKFKSELEKLRPEWFGDPAIENKNLLIVMAKTDENRPVTKKHPLGCPLVRYTNESCSSYDAIFDDNIRKLRPDWFAVSSTSNKEKIIKIAKSGKKRPLQKKGELGRCLSAYLSKKNECYDPVFSELINILRPDWFADTVSEKKRKLIKIAQAGKNKPKTNSVLSRALYNYCQKSNHLYDANFYKELSKYRPDWFANSTEPKKQTLISMARNGESKPKWKTPIGRALVSYTRPKSESFDKDFNKKIRNIRPDWFKGRAVCQIS